MQVLDEIRKHITALPPSSQTRITSVIADAKAEYELVKSSAAAHMAIIGLSCFAAGSLIGYLLGR